MLHPDSDTTSLGPLWSGDIETEKYGESDVIARCNGRLEDKFDNEISAVDGENEKLLASVLDGEVVEAAECGSEAAMLVTKTTLSDETRILLGLGAATIRIIRWKSLSILHVI